LETIVFKDKPEKEKSLVEKVFSDKSKTLKSTIKALHDEIKLRETLDSHLLTLINEDICRHHTFLDQLNNLRVHYVWDQYKDINDFKMQFENNVLDLEKEKRKEYLDCWRDLMFLKKYLLSACKEYWDLTKKSKTSLYPHHEFHYYTVIECHIFHLGEY
ncbi:MAG TPA: hypothetical protein VMZ04_00935, partial [Anaerolineae bacterium]|nr:hypothetical protein [Anaerolineae bacterium]